MSSTLIIPFPPVKLARAAWARVIGVLLIGLLATIALAFYGYELHRLRGAVDSYQQAVFQYQMRTEAIDRLSDMEAAFNRYLLDSNSANTGLIQADKQRIEQLAQANADAQNDKVLQQLVAAEQKWYGQAVQPLIEERRKLAAGQGLPEDFLAKYRAAPQDLQIINFETTAEDAYHQAQQSLATGGRSIALAMDCLSPGCVARGGCDLAIGRRDEKRKTSQVRCGEPGR